MFDISLQLTFSLFFLLSETEMYNEITIDLHRSAQIQQKLLFGFVFITILNFDFALYPDCTTTCILMLPNSVQTPVQSSQVAGCFSVLCQGQVHNRAVETLFCKHQSKLNVLQKSLTTCWGFCTRRLTWTAVTFYPFTSFTLNTPALEPFPPHNINCSTPWQKVSSLFFDFLVKTDEL